MVVKLDNAVLPVNKSKGISTYDLIRKFRGAVRIGKVGHSGTLDPDATGLVLLLTGEATKLAGYLMDLPKRYIADVMLGESTDTMDSSGDVVRRGDWSKLTEGDISSTLSRFLGKRLQTPPMYSALKYKGTPLYVLARRGQTVDRRPREVSTYEIKLIDCELPIFRIEVYCSRGLYLRVLAEEIGDSMGVPAHLHSLIRTRIGHFDVETALDDNDLDNTPELEKHAHSLSDALRHLPTVELTAEQTRRLGNGTAPRPASALPPPGSLVRLVKPDGRLGAIGEVGSGGDIQIRRNFRYPPDKG